MKFKRSIAILVIILLITSLTACASKDEPLNVVREYFKCLALGDFDKADRLCTESIFSEEFFSTDRNMSRLLIDDPTNKENVMKGVYLKAAAGSTIAGDKATVKVKIASYDLKTLLSDYMMLVFMNTDSENTFNGPLMIENMLATTQIVQNEITIHLQKSNNSYLIVPDEELADAISGGLATAAEIETVASTTAETDGKERTSVNENETKK